MSLSTAYGRITVGAGRRIDALVDYTRTGEAEILRGDAAGRRQSIESRCVVPSVANAGHGLGGANGLIVEEGEDLVLPNGTAYAAAELVKKVVVPQHVLVLAVEALIGVQARTVNGEESTAMDLVGAALGSDLNLGSAEASILRIIAIRDDFHAFN
jgi:hypothetical protein